MSATFSDTARPPTRGARAPRVLVLDDEADLRELLELTLVGMGLDVDCAADLAEARKHLAANRYALCLTDMRLPDGNGLELVAEVAQEWPDTPVVVITAYGSAENAVAALKAGAFDYLSKPVALDALRTLVRSALQLGAATAEGSAPGSMTGGVPANMRGAAGSAPGSAAASVASNQPIGPGAPGGLFGPGGSTGPFAASRTNAASAASGSAGGAASGSTVGAASGSTGGAAASAIGTTASGTAASSSEPEARRHLARSGSSAGALAHATDTASDPASTLPAATEGVADPVDSGGPMLGISPAIALVRAAVARLARSMAPVAITGESGAGKEMVARMIHLSGVRARQPFVAVNCGAIPETLMEAEFFGHRKGAFTGADRDRDGFFQAASGGTLFLDEVADLPLAMQVKLLRAIQEKRVRRIGGTSEEPVDVRIISATHQDLARCVAAGRFRQDLYYRLNVIELGVPPLRERIDDIPVLAEAILARLAARAGSTQTPRLASVTIKYLQSYGFPGNVRELENILERAIAFSNGEVINVEDLGLRPTAAEASESEPADPVQASTTASVAHRPARLSADGIPESLPEYLDQVERDAIAKALEKTRFNRTAAARHLGISFRALRYRMQRLGMQ